MAILRRTRCERCGPRDVSIAVVMRDALVEILMKAQLRRVTGRQEILAIQVRDEHALVAGREPVQLRIGVLLAHVEDRRVVLKAIVVEVAEEARAQVHVVENKPAEIADERL